MLTHKLTYIKTKHLKASFLIYRGTVLRTTNAAFQLGRKRKSATFPMAPFQHRLNFKHMHCPIQVEVLFLAELVSVTRTLALFVLVKFDFRKINFTNLNLSYDSNLIT